MHYIKARKWNFYFMSRNRPIFLIQKFILSFKVLRTHWSEANSIAFNKMNYCFIQMLYTHWILLRWRPANGDLVHISIFSWFLKEEIFENCIEKTNVLQQCIWIESNKINVSNTLNDRINVCIEKIGRFLNIK